MTPRRWVRRFATFISVAGISASNSPPAVAQLIDDFESYADTTALLTQWSAVTLDTTTPNRLQGTKSLRRSQTMAPFSGWFSRHEFLAHVDLTGQRVRAWVRRDPDSVSPISVTLQLYDGSGNPFFCQSSFFEISGDDWHEVVLDVAVCAGTIDVSDIEFVGLAATNFTKAEGLVAANFDDVHHDLFSDGFESEELTAWSHVQT